MQNIRGNRRGLDYNIALAAAIVKQIIADLASTFAFVNPEIFLTVALHRKPLVDAEPPRTTQMWLDYDT